MSVVYRKKARIGAAALARPFCTAVLVFKPVDIVLVEVAEGDFEEGDSLGAACHAVLGVAWREERVAFAHYAFLAADVCRAGAFQDAPEFIAMLVRLQAERLAGVHGDDLHGRRFVQGEPLEIAPWARLFLVVIEAFHGGSIAPSKEGLENGRKSGSMHECEVPR